MMLCEQLAARGVEVDLLTSELPPGFPTPRGFRLHPVMKSWGWSQFSRLLLSIRRLRPDAVFLIYIDWIYGCHPMITFAPAVFRWLQPHTPFVTQFENQSGLTGVPSPSGIKARLVQTILGRLVGRRGLHSSYGSLLRDSSCVIALCERHVEAFERAHPGVGSKTRIIPAPPIMRLASEATSGSARHRGRALLGISEEEVVLSYFGYVYRMKGVETLLKAFGSLPPDTRLVIIGGSEDNSYLERLREVSRRAGCAERVTWVGHCKPEEELASLYLYATDICVLPFDDGIRLNNSSFSVAASHGLPIVSTRGESLESAFLDGENVRLCPPKDPAALAAAVMELIRSPEARCRLATGALRLAENHLSWDRVIDSTLEVIRASAAPK
jgi:polysaccharide biosynthesis protein PslF